MKRLLLLVIFPILFNGALKAQEFYRNELGIFGGGSYYIGDLNPSKHFLQTKFACGIVYRYNITPRWALKINALYGGLEASDARSKANVNRNLSFKSYIFEFSPQIEFNFLKYLLGDKKHFISPYIFVGASIFNFNPKAQYGGSWYSLQPLGTEGQGTTIEGAKKTYALTTIAIPFGLGVKIAPFKFLSIGLEWGIRKTFTDYIDDVSTNYADPSLLAAMNGSMALALSDPSTIKHEAGVARGNPNTKDWYVFTGLSISFRIKTKNGLCPAYEKHPKLKTKYRD